MDFLSEILGEELFSKVQEKINAHNEANKDNQIKLANLASGAYVSKDKFNSKESELEAKVNELLEANNLISDLKKGNKDNATLQEQIGAYNAQIEQLQAQINETRINSAIEVALIREKALDVDYLSYKLNEKMRENGESFELDENENIKDWNEKIDGLKVQFPHLFESASSKKVVEKKLEAPDNNSGAQVTKAEFEKMGYNSRVALKSSNPELYSQLSN